MITFTVTAYFTSKDLQEIAVKMRNIEQTATPGQSAVAAEWRLGDGHVLRISLDQERARRTGLRS